MEAIFGVKDHLTTLQECDRAVLIFFYGLVMLRLSGKRTFSQWSALDVILSIVVGSCLSRAMTGSAPLPGTLAAVAVLVGLHVAVAFGAAWSTAFSRIVEGAPVTLIHNGKANNSLMLRHLVSKCDLDQTLREHKLEGFTEISKVKQARLEPNGSITVLKA